MRRGRRGRSLRAAHQASQILRAALLGSVLLIGCRPAGPPATLPHPGLEGRTALRVGIAVGVDQTTVSSSTPFELITTTTGERSRASAGERWTFTTDAAGQIRGESDRGNSFGPTTALVRVEVPRGRAPILIDGKPYRGGALLRAAGPGKITAINLLEIEEYLLGVVPLEIGPRPLAELEAVKAQAVAARTYAVRHLGGREPLGFDLYSTVADQVYGGIEVEDPTAARAVRETRGEIITYQGSPILAYYHSTCGGRTAAIEEVWPHRQPLPYLRSVSDESSPGQYYCESSRLFRWDLSWTGPELRRILALTLAKRGGRADPLPIDELKRVETEGRTPSGRARSLVVETDLGRSRVDGDSIRWILERAPGEILYSTLFELEETRSGGVVTALRAHGGGWGHGVGMCQVGALGRARAGQDYRQILTTYYQGTEVTRVY